MCNVLKTNRKVCPQTRTCYSGLLQYWILDETLNWSGKSGAVWNTWSTKHVESRMPQPSVVYNWVAVTKQNDVQTIQNSWKTCIKQITVDCGALETVLWLNNWLVMNWNVIYRATRSIGTREQSIVYPSLVGVSPLRRSRHKPILWYYHIFRCVNNLYMCAVCLQPCVARYVPYYESSGIQVITNNGLSDSGGYRLKYAEPLITKEGQSAEVLLKVVYYASK